MLKTDNMGINHFTSKYAKSAGTWLDSVISKRYILVVITLAFWGILRGVALLMTGGETIVRFPDEMAFFG